MQISARERGYLLINRFCKHNTQCIGFHFLSRTSQTTGENSSRPVIRGNQWKSEIKLQIMQHISNGLKQTVGLFSHCCTLDCSPRTANDYLTSCTSLYLNVPQCASMYLAVPHAVPQCTPLYLTFYLTHFTNSLLAVLNRGRPLLNAAEADQFLNFLAGSFFSASEQFACSRRPRKVYSNLLCNSTNFLQASCAFEPNFFLISRRFRVCLLYPLGFSSLDLFPFRISSNQFKSSQISRACSVNYLVGIHLACHCPFGVRSFGSRRCPLGVASVCKSDKRFVQPENFPVENACTVRLIF